MTQLYGPNGCGKTPLVQSIAFCLGFPSIFRNDIYNHCSHVELNVEFGEKNLKSREFIVKT
ncbi:ATP-binding protein [Shewanella algae]|uniref:ATP-binding protein n=1 Tax=Shewanella algae TaxID=38313 RepID=UPI002180A430|nr:ATP-binding protein [Shewanella algae]